MDNLKDIIMHIIWGNKDYNEEYQNNPLFHEIINGIVESEEPLESIVNTLYSYNQMLTNITSVIAKDADDESVNKVIEHLQSQLEEDNQ